MVLSFYCVENTSKEKLNEVESEIKQLAGLDNIFLFNLTDEKKDELEELLNRRRWILNQLFKFSPENIKRIIAVR